MEMLKTFSAFDYKINGDRQGTRSSELPKNFSKCSLSRPISLDQATKQTSLFDQKPSCQTMTINFE